MTQPLSPASLVLSLPVEAWVERHGDDLVIRWTPDAPLLALYAGPAPDGMGGVPLPTAIDAAGTVSYTHLSAGQPALSAR